MPNETIVCGRCGVENAPGDQFCGSCGAFLEWEGEPGAAATGAGNDAPTVVVPIVTPIVSPPPSRPDPGSVVCSACHTANPPGRVFCQSCGTELVPDTASPPLEPVRAWAPATKRPDRMPLVALGLGALLVLVIAFAVFGGGLLGDPAASSGATSGPIAGGTSSPGATATSAPTTPTVAPTDGETPAPPTDAPTAAPAPTPKPGVELTLTGASASSVVGNLAKFAPDRVIDARIDTAWQEGKAVEEGEWIEVTFARARVDRVVIYGGYQLSEEAYHANLRPRDVLIQVANKPAVAARLDDVFGQQTIELGGIIGKKLRIVIVNTYDSQATSYPGSPFDDMAISEIIVIGALEG